MCENQTGRAMNEPEKSRPPLTVHAPLSLERGRGFQFVEFKPGMTGVIESGRVMSICSNNRRPNPQWGPRRIFSAVIQYNRLFRQWTVRQNLCAENWVFTFIGLIL